MKYIRIFCLFLLIPVSSLAQQSVVSSGGSAQGANGSADYSVGQAVFHTYQGAGGSVSEGIQQPYEIYIPIGIEELNGREFRIYPNPSVDFIRIDQGSSEPEKLSWEIHDISGKIIEKGKIISKETNITVSGYASGTYLLIILKDDLKIREYKIIKE